MYCRVGTRELSQDDQGHAQGQHLGTNIKMFNNTRENAYV